MCILLSICIDDCSAWVAAPRRAVIDSMQALRALNRTLALVEKRGCSVSQLPELTRWHAGFISNFAARNSINAGSAPHRQFAAMPFSTGKQRLVILGTGWAAARLTMDIDCNHFDITVRSTHCAYNNVHPRESSLCHISHIFFTCCCCFTGGVTPESHGIHTVADFGVCGDFGVPECSCACHVTAKAPQGASERLPFSICSECRPRKEGCAVQS